MERLRRDIHFEPIGFDLLDDTFTIPDLQRLYEAILGVKFDRRNFQRKIMASGILEEADAPELEESAMLYEAAPAPMMMADMDFCAAMPEPMMEERSLKTAMAEPELPRSRKGRPGRIASLFRLNRAKYDEMKEDGGKTEF